MKRKSISVALSLLVTASMVVGCGSNASDSTSDSSTAKNDSVKKYEATDLSKSPDAANKRKDTIIIGTSEPKGIFLPTISTTEYDRDIDKMMFEQLMVPDEKGEMNPRLAESVEADETGTTYTIKLKDAKWSDGEPITAEDVALPYYIIADPSYAGNADIVDAAYDNVEGAKEYKEGTAKEISGIKIVDDKTLTVKFTSFSPFSLADIGSIQPLPSHYLKDKFSQGNLDGLKNQYANPDMPVSGQYKLKDYKKGQETVLEANENFHLGTPKIKNVIMKVTTPDTQISMLKSGEIDMDLITPTNSDNIDEVEGAGFLGYEMFPSNSYTYMSFNQALPQFKDVEVRKALTIGLDRKKIVDTVYDGYATVPKIPESTVSWAYSEPENSYDYDVEKAKKILDDAGWKAGADGIREKDGTKLSMRLLVSNTSAYAETVLAVAESCYKELGVDYKGEQIDFNILVDKTDAKDFDAYVMGWGLTEVPGGDTTFYSKGSQNFNSYKSEKIDELTEKIQSEHGGQDALKELYKEYYNELNETLPYTCLVQGNTTYAYNGRIKNMEMSSYVRYPFNLYKATIDDAK